MPEPLLLTKLYAPPPRHNLVLRPRLIERLNEGLSSGRKLTLISAPAGFGKTTLISEWIAGPKQCPPGQVCGKTVAWLSLDEADNDPARFVTYLVAALQTIKAGIGDGLMASLRSPQPMQIEAILTSLLNEIAISPEHFVLILDDYHNTDSKPVDQSLGFLVENQPPQMHLVITTREDPQLPLARYRARGQLTELRAADLRFTPEEAAEFFNQITGLSLSVENISALETRTEGWIAGLQLAALALIALRGHQDTNSFIKSFTGSHHFVLDYLVEEVLQHQTDRVQAFLLHTSILDRICGPLCDAILSDSPVSGQKNLEYLERSNLFIVPLDNERHWYRYHHLFGDLLRKRLTQRLSHQEINALHIKASEWFENNDLILEAFHHAAEADDIERAERLMESKQMPLYQRDAAYAILNWLESLPTTILDRKPTFWWKQASLMLVMGQTEGVEEKLQATEASIAATTLPGFDQDDLTRNLIGKIAVARSMLALTHGDTENMFVQAHRALENLHPNNLSYRSSATRTLGFAYYFKGDWAAAYQAYADALSLAQRAGDVTNCLLASIRLGQMQELRNQLCLAAETFQGVLQHIGEYSPPNSPVVYNGLAWIYYEWNDLDTAERYGELGLQMAQRYDQVIDRVILNALLLGYIRLAKGDIPGAESFLLLAEESVRQKKHDLRLPDIAGMRVSIDLQLGNTSEAYHLAQQYDLPLLHARVFFALGDPSEAVKVLIPYHQKAEANGFENERLRAQVLLAFAYYLQGDEEPSRKMLTEALTQTEPEGFIRLFIDRGEQMRMFLLEYKSWIEKKDGKRPHPLQGYVEKILAAFPELKPLSALKTNNLTSEMVEPLSQRELEVLELICQGLSNQEICERLFLALDTVKGHNRRIFDKLQVHRRTEAIARARELRLL